MSKVEGYYTPQAAPRAYQAPVPTSAPGRVQTFGTDDYAGVGAELSGLARPFAPGAVAGFNAKLGVSRASGFYRAANRAKRFGTRVKATRAGRQVSFGGVVSGIKYSAAFSGLLSIFSNGYQVYKGQETMPVASGKIVGDVVSSTAAGAAAAGTSWLASTLLVSTLGPGLGLTLVGLGVGLVTFAAADALVRQTTIFQNIQSGAERMIAKVLS